MATLLMPLLGNDVLFVSMIILGDEEALHIAKQLEISHACKILTNDCQILALSLLSTVCAPL